MTELCVIVKTVTLGVLALHKPHLFTFLENRFSSRFLT